MSMKPYYEHAGITIYHGDCREILPNVRGSVVISDPVWPNCRVPLVGSDRPFALLTEALELCEWAARIAIQVGCDTDPRFLAAVPVRWEFFRACWLEFSVPWYKGRLLNTGDVAYLFGLPPASRSGAHVIPGRCISITASEPKPDHPCPRNLAHLDWLINWWTAAEDVVVDPFMGSGTTIEAAKNKGLCAIGIEIEERYCEIAAKRLSQEVFEFGAQDGASQSPSV